MSNTFLVSTQPVLYGLYAAILYHKKICGFLMLFHIGFFLFFLLCLLRSHFFVFFLTASFESYTTAIFSTKPILFLFLLETIFCILSSQFIGIFAWQPAFKFYAANFCIVNKNFLPSLRNYVLQLTQPWFEFYSTQPFLFIVKNLSTQPFLTIFF